MGEPIDLSRRGLERLGISPETQRVLLEIKAEVDVAYSERFAEMASAINRQAAILERIQRTLEVLIEAVAPTLAGRLPAAVRVVPPDEEPDLASAVVVADPIGAGFTLSQANIADALGLPQPDVSVLIRAFRLHEDPESAVAVRRGGDKGRTILNYRPEVIDRFRQLVRNPPADFPKKHRARLSRVARQLGKPDNDG